MYYFLVPLTLALTLCACSSPSGDSNQPRDGSSRSAPGATPSSNSQTNPRIVSTSHGEAYALRLRGETLDYCDEEGAHSFDLKSGIVHPGKNTCPRKEEANSACSGLPGDPSVRSTPNEPDEIVDLKGNSYPLRGRVQDCVAAGALLAIATNSSVFWIDPAGSAKHEVPSSGGDRVALGAGWIVWTQGARLYAQSIR